MFMLVFNDKNSSTSSSVSPLKHLEFSRSPKKAISVRDVNKPRTSRSTLARFILETDHPSSINTERTMRRTMEVSRDSSRVDTVFIVPDTNVECVTVQSK